MTLANKAACERMCVSCRQGKNKLQLLRLVKSADGTVFRDRDFKAGGRGAYLCKNIKCIEKAEKEKRLERALKTKVNAELYEELKKLSESK